VTCDDPIVEQLIGEIRELPTESGRRNPVRPVLDHADDACFEGATDVRARCAAAPNELVGKPDSRLLLTIRRRRESDGQPLVSSTALGSVRVTKPVSQLPASIGKGRVECLQQGWPVSREVGADSGCDLERIHPVHHSPQPPSGWITRMDIRTVDAASRLPSGGTHFRGFARFWRTVGLPVQQFR
jgi:hypothetical protein